MCMYIQKVWEDNIFMPFVIFVRVTKTFCHLSFFCKEASGQSFILAFLQTILHLINTMWRWHLQRAHVLRVFRGRFVKGRKKSRCLAVQCIVCIVPWLSSASCDLCLCKWFFAYGVMAQRTFYLRFKWRFYILWRCLECSILYCWNVY